MLCIVICYDYFFPYKNSPPMANATQRAMEATVPGSSVAGALPVKVATGLCGAHVDGETLVAATPLADQEADPDADAAATGRLEAATDADGAAHGVFETGTTSIV